MAVEPVFSGSYDILVEKLRLKDVSDTLKAVIENAIQDVRVRIYDAIGASRTAELLGTSLVDNPTTDSELLRLKAAIMEEKWVRAVLLSTLPTYYLGSNISERDAFNQDGLTRDKTQEQIAGEISGLMNQVQDYIDDLVAAKDSDAGTARVSVLEPTIAPVPISTSIFLPENII